jgi:hypothetical protein
MAERRSREAGRPRLVRAGSGVTREHGREPKRRKQGGTEGPACSRRLGAGDTAGRRARSAASCRPRARRGLSGCSRLGCWLQGLAPRTVWWCWNQSVSNENLTRQTRPTKTNRVYQGFRADSWHRTGTRLSRSRRAVGFEPRSIASWLASLLAFSSQKRALRDLNPRHLGPKPSTLSRLS